MALPHPGPRCSHHAPVVPHTLPFLENPAIVGAIPPGIARALSLSTRPQPPCNRKESSNVRRLSQQDRLHRQAQSAARRDAERPPLQARRRSSPPGRPRRRPRSRPRSTATSRSSRPPRTPRPLSIAPCKPATPSPRRPSPATRRSAWFKAMLGKKSQSLVKVGVSRKDPGPRPRSSRSGPASSRRARPAWPVERRARSSSPPSRGRWRRRCRPRRRSRPRRRPRSRRLSRPRPRPRASPGRRRPRPPDKENSTQRRKGAKTQKSKEIEDPPLLPFSPRVFAPLR